MWLSAQLLIVREWKLFDRKKNINWFHQHIVVFTWLFCYDLLSISYWDLILSSCKIWVWQTMAVFWLRMLGWAHCLRNSNIYTKAKFNENTVMATVSDQHLLGLLRVEECLVSTYHWLFITHGLSALFILDLISC